VFTGDTLFVGDVGRPDLLASEGTPADDLAGMLHASIARLRELPDSTLVYPAHGPGSMCGKSLGPETSSTIGVQRRANPMMRPMPKAEFVRLVTADQPDAPGYFSYDVAMNRRAHPTLEAALSRELRPMAVAAVLAARDGGATVLDVREPAAFSAGHLEGSVNIGLSGRFASWAGTLLDREKPIVLVADPGREAEAALRLGRIGFDHVVGFLEGGPAAFASRPDAVRRAARVDPEGACRLLEDDASTVVLDVRTPAEWRAARVRDSVNLPLQRLLANPSDVPRGRPILVHCQSGYRSSIAASLLRRAGVSAIADLAGGMNAWQVAQLPVVTEDPEPSRT
jgi:rhodanese-related sulfurtransferase